MADIEALMREYFECKEKDKAIRKERNEYMASHECLNAKRPTTDFKDQSDYEDNGGECIHKTVGMGGYPAPMCEVCEKRHEWYSRRQELAHRRSAIMRRIKRAVMK